MRNQNLTQLVPGCVSLLEYFSFSDPSFCVLSDQATLVGVNEADWNTVTKQSIIDRSAPIVVYTANIGHVYTVAVDEPNNILFAGSSNLGGGQVIQYDLSTGQAVKNYAHVGIGRILSSASAKAGSLWLFGSRGSSRFTVIDPISRRIVHSPVITAIRNIYSMTIGTVYNSDSEDTVLLFIAGDDSEYANDRSDVFDITELTKRNASFSVSQLRTAQVLGKRSFFR